MSDEKIPQIAYWMDVPLSEVPRDELEAAFIEVNRELQQLREENCRLSVQSIRDAAEAGKLRLRAQHPIMNAIFS